MLGHWAPNASHNLNTFFTDTGIEVRPYDEDDDAWSFSMRLAGVGTNATLEDAMGPALYVDKNRFAYQRGNVTEWYVNNAHGLEQGFTIQAPPEGVTDELVLALDIDGNLGARVISDGMVVLDDGDGEPDLYLRNLHVEDATGTQLPARFASVTGGGLGITVDVTEASYPVVVDPVLS